MQVPKCQSHLHSEKLSLFLFKSLDLDKMAEKFPTLHEFHQEIDTVLILEHKFHIHQEWMVNLE
jgi:hypothetical protein